MTDERSAYTGRMYMVLTAMLMLPLIIMVALTRLFLYDGEALTSAGINQSTAWITLPAQRGDILDRNGRALVLNTVQYTVALDPSVSQFTEEKATALYDSLAILTGRAAETFRTRVAERTSPKYVVLLAGAGERTRETIAGWDIPGVILDPAYVRSYQYNTLAAHVLGLVDRDGTGLSGVELSYDSFLRGEDGRREVRRDRRQRLSPVAGGRVEPPQDGETLVLTLDQVGQSIVEAALDEILTTQGARWASAVAVDPTTGAVRAMATWPPYDPDRPGAVDVSTRRNRAITDMIEPGSTFKVVPMITGLTIGAFALSDSIDTNEGRATYGGYEMRDDHPIGKAPLSDVLAQSSNVGMAMLGRTLPRGPFFQTARALGFGAETRIDLPGEAPGTLKRPSTWSGTTPSSMSIGYELLATPIQLAMAYAAIANGGTLHRPYIVAERRSATGDLRWRATPEIVRTISSPVVMDSIRQALVHVVETGTGRAARVRGMSVGGKTGTALKVVNGAYQRSSTRASFAGFFPADQPSLVVVVVVDEPRGSIYAAQSAAPIFGSIARRWSELPEIKRSIPTVYADHPVEIPDVTNLPIHEAKRQLYSAGLEPRSVLSSRDTVLRTDPLPGRLVEPGTAVRLIAP